MEEIGFIFDHGFVRIPYKEKYSPNQMYLDGVIVDYTEELLQLTDSEIISELRKLKRDYTALQDPAKVIDTMPDKELSELLDKRAELYFKRQMLTNAYAIKKGADWRDIGYISREPFPHKWDVGSAKSLFNSIQEEILYNMEFDPRAWPLWESMVSKGMIPPYGVSNALCWENTEEVSCLPWKDTIAEDKKQKLIKRLHEEGDRIIAEAKAVKKRNGSNGSTEICLLVSGAMSADCFKEIPKRKQIENEFGISVNDKVFKNSLISHVSKQNAFRDDYGYCMEPTDEVKKKWRPIIPAKRDSAWFNYYSVFLEIMN